VSLLSDDAFPHGGGGVEVDELVLLLYRPTAHSHLLRG
jgi:hypothetical protein